MPALQPLVEEENERPEVEVADCLLGHHVKITTTDSRTFTGTLMCLDHFGNLLLYDVIEEINTIKKAHKRLLNQIIISMDKLQAVSVLVTKDDKVLRIMLLDEMVSCGNILDSSCARHDIPT